MISKYQIFVILIIVNIIGLISANQTPEQKCILGKEYFDGCNNCYCQVGNIVTCTKKLCQKYDLETRSEVPVALLPAPSDFWE
ncbi:PREDICTED: uncharacterized protein LOC108779208 [Cyphomyrmex costatus]|uniref:uncharacterized protein LOC108779208 n=1 Tax=Cyphomyrmex costatus TaxID=456900 RepID=UPI00085230C5|nr:PREDICTED: uncharacterized protein LOC108779208 [Cyphomyrmex costatus]